VAPRPFVQGITLGLFAVAADIYQALAAVLLLFFRQNTD